MAERQSAPSTRALCLQRHPRCSRYLLLGTAVVLLLSTLKTTKFRLALSAGSRIVPRASAARRASSGDAEIDAPSVPSGRGIPATPSPMDIAESQVQVISSDDISAVRSELEQERRLREESWELSRQVSVLCTEVTNALQYGLPGPAAEAQASAQQLLQTREETSPHQPRCRDSSLQQACENYVRIEALQWFFRSGTVLPRKHLGAAFDDDEYLAGIIGVCQDLVHYALRRATAIDTQSVRLCRDFVGDVKAELLGFDFRNGPLRKKFDGVKYAERRCEDLLYELSFVVPAIDLDDSAIGSALDQQEWVQLRDEYAKYDQKRELVIKGCRDAQKAAKQAIYAAQRGDLRKSRELVAAANAVTQEVWDVHIRDTPGLRYGSFSNALEELAEAEMFLSWLSSQQAGAPTHSGADVQSLLLPRRVELASGLLQPVEYLGALSDFTGEVGRVAVQAATKRDLSTVQSCLQAVFASHAVLASMPLSGKGLEKVQAAERNLWKLEAVEYDMAVRAGMRGAGAASSIADSYEQAED